jgi:hypothetical protein
MSICYKFSSFLDQFMKGKNQNYFCLCKSLEKYAQDFSVPVEYEKETDNFFLVFNPSEKSKINYCFFCGGKELSQITEKTNECNCSSVINWSQTPTFPIEYDPKYQEFNLLAYGKSKLVMYYCPVCGGQLPKSKRSDFFTTPSDEEMNEITAKLKNINKVEDVVKIFGTPDKKSGARKVNRADREIYELKDLKKTLVFNSIAKTLNLIVQEDENGKVSYFFAGKPKMDEETA